MTLAQLDHADLANQSACVGDLLDGVHYVVCTVNADRDTPRGADFLAAVAHARHLVMTGARRIVFLIAGDGADAALHRSLVQFASHVGRTMPSRPVDFAVMPLAGAGLPH